MTIVAGGVVPLVVPSLAVPASAAPVNTTQRVSVASDGTQGNATTSVPSISADGRYVVFASSATNLVPGDLNGKDDIFLRDWVSGKTERISVGPNGAEATDMSFGPSVSADGRYVAFSSFASNLVSGDTNGFNDVFVRDRVTQTTERVSVSSTGAQALWGASGTSISADGRYVSFGTTSQLVAADTDSRADIYVRDRTASTTERDTLNSGTNDSYGGIISGDGRFVTFHAGGPSPSLYQVYEYDRTTGTTQQVSVDATGISGNSNSYEAGISSDGRYVAFYSDAANLIGAADTNSATDVFVRDRVAGTTERISVDSTGTQANGTSNSGAISADGRYVLFRSTATNLVSGDINGYADTFVRDRLAPSTERVSVGTTTGDSSGGGVSADGRFVAFYSAASDVVNGDTNAVPDDFLRERQPVQAPIGTAVTPESRRGGGSPSMLLDCPTPHADPCDVSTGNFFDTATDLSIPGRGIPLEFTRTYNSYPSPAAPADGPLGYGWSYTYGMSLGVVGSTVTITEENGAQITFTQSGSTYTAPTSVQATLSNSAGVWTFIRKGRETFTFNSSGQLTSISDLNNYHTNLTYVSGKLSTVTDPAGRTLTIGWNGTHIASVTDTASPARSVNFTYTSSNLTDAVDVGGGHTQYGYDANHRMVVMRRPNFFSDGALPAAVASCIATGPLHTTANHYDASGRIDCQYDPLGRVTTFDYTSSPGSTKVTDPKLNVRVDTFTSGLLTSRILGSGTSQAATWTYTYDPALLALTATVDANGDAITTIYDSYGNALTTTDQLGRTTLRTYNPPALRVPTTVRDPMYVTTTYVYDSAGNIQSESTPVSTGGTRTTGYTYGDAIAHPGDVTSITDPDGKVWPQTWDSSGNLSTKVDPYGNTTRYCYDTVGRKTRQIAPKGSAAGMVCATSNPTYTTLITPDAFGDPISVTDALGHTTQTSYDLNRNTVSTTDALGQTTSSSYDPANQLIEQSNPWSILLRDDFTGTSGSWNTGQWGTTSGVTLAGNQGVLASAATPSRATAKTMADTVDSEASFTYAFSATANSTLRVALRAWGTGVDKTTGADMPNGYRLEINPSTAQIQLTKIVAGTVTNLGAAVSYASGTATQRVRFQTQGSIIRAKVWAATTSEPSTWTIEQTDTSVTAPGVMQLSHIQASGTQNVAIDDLTVLDAATPQGAAWTSPVRVADDFTGTSGVAWDGDRWGTTGIPGVSLSSSQGSLAATTASVRATAKAMPDVMDSEANFTYSLSNTTSASNFRISLRASGASKTSGAQMTNGYRLEISPSSSAVHIKKIVNSTVTDLGSFTYSLTGSTPQRVRFQVQGSTIRAKIWALGSSEPSTWSLSVTDSEITAPGVLQLANSFTSNALTVTVDDLAVLVGNSERYDYNLDGTLNHSYDGAGQATTNAYDAQGRLTSVTDPFPHTTTYGYDPAGNRTTQQDPGGNCAGLPPTGCTTTKYDGANQVVGITYSDGTTPNVTMGYDLDGRRTTMTDGTGTSSWVYDSLGRLTSSTNGAGKIVGYGYDLRGNRTSIAYPNSAGTVTQTFDDASRMTKVTDWLTHQTVFNYDADSFMTSQVYPNTTTATYSPDNADGLKTVNHAKAGSSFAKFDYTRDNNDRLASKTETVTAPAVADNRAWTYSAAGQLKTDNGALYATDAAANLTRQTSGAVQGYDTADEMNATSTISVVGTPTGAADSTSTSLALTLPAGIAANDQIILAATVPFAQTPLTPTGYTVVGTYTAGTTAKVIVYRRPAMASDTTVTVNFVTAYGKALNLVVYRGVNPTTPIDTSQTINGTATTRVTIPSLTATVPGDRLTLIQGAVPATPGTWSTPVDTTPQGPQQQPANGSAAGLITDQTTLAASASGPRPITFSTSGALIGVLLALKPNQTTDLYDSRGNRTSITPPGGSATNLTYDQANRLTAYGSTASYTYDGDGIRTSKTVSGSTRFFAWDSHHNLLVDGTTNYIYGPGGLPLEQIATGGTVTYYHQDQDGNTRALTNASGTVIATYTYDSVGNLTASTGSVSNPFGFASQYVDSETGFIYSTKRYYDPATAQFTSRADGSPQANGDQWHSDEDWHEWHDDQSGTCEEKRDRCYKRADKWYTEAAPEECNSFATPGRRALCWKQAMDYYSAWQQGCKDKYERCRDRRVTSHNDEQRSGYDVIFGPYKAFIEFVAQAAIRSIGDGFGGPALPGIPPIISVPPFSVPPFSLAACH